jgi:hypothetical protein
MKTRRDEPGYIYMKSREAQADTSNVHHSTLMIQHETLYICKRQIRQGVR